MSRDLIHWEELPPVLEPLIDNRPGSRSGVVDWNDLRVRFLQANRLESIWNVRR